MTAQHSFLIATFCALSAWSLRAQAGVSAEEADRLKSELTPFGAQRAGNREGTIPAWDGGFTRPWPGYHSGEPRPDPFAEEKPLFSITAANVDRYAAKLSDGIKELLRRFPGYRLEVYPTHRTAAAPPWVYDNTFANATRAKTRKDGLAVEGAFGGIPFPIPGSAREAMWNHLLAWKGEAAVEDGAVYLVSGGTPVMTAARRADYQYPYYYRDGSVDRFKGILAMTRYLGIKPPNVAGEAYLVLDPIDQAEKRSQAWGYMVGQRRARPLPPFAYDMPDSTTSGLNMQDEAWLFRGGMDRYEWRLLGKREMFVPYNENGLTRGRVTEVLSPHHLNPDSLRWELHRVWVVEAHLAAGQRHAVARRRIYLDEDSWLALLYDGWDGDGRLWHVAHALPQIVPELPAVVAVPYAIYDLAKDRYAALYLWNEGQLHYQVVPRRPEDYFSPGALVSEGVR